MSSPKSFTSVYQIASYRPLITREDVMKITVHAGIIARFRLLFVRSHLCFDDGATIRYKQLGSTIYVMKRGTRL